MRNCYRVPGNFRQHPRNALAAAGNAKPRPMPGQTHVDQGEGGPITSSSRDDSDCRTSKGRRLAASGRDSSIGHREIKAVEPIRCGDPDRPARSLRPDTRLNRYAVMAATALDAAMPATETPTGMDATLSPVPVRVGAHADQISRTQDIPAAMSPRCNGVIG